MKSNETGQDQNIEPEKTYSRRTILKSAGIGSLGVIIGASGLGGVISARESASNSAKANKNTIPFYGKHQAGIATTKPALLYFASFDVKTESRAELIEMLKDWTKAAAAMASGEMIGGTQNSVYLPPEDTGEAAALDTANLTLTFGVGPTLFKKNGKNRFGIAHKLPQELKKLPAFSLDALDKDWCDGDLCVQVCSDDAQVNFHAIRNLVRIARGKAILKWSQEGFQGKNNPHTKNETPRNLFGFKDETVNLSPEKKMDFDKHVWVQSGDGPNWLTGGSYLVVRRIQMHIEVWDRTALGEQEKTFGRHRITGAPLGKEKEFSDLGLDRKDEAGNFVIPVNAHARQAHGKGDQPLYRRSFSYSSGMAANTGTLDAGLFFMCFQRFPSKQFIPVQKRLGQSDKLNEYITHRGSAIFACLPGIRKGGWIGETLFS
ncbi:iron uptake transporter deferrochelatase/peroxidase subunit [Aciduricibacillus chroicocephali]|uniref:Deferrochelatase n=1 Tax=Aciduricibacillus chroicocephali TaxID=3054939 RepID=A0ABY9KXT8_9BACI|nr:iron uptake transporter deferrochelatase/peroxidase subunit [Bacillaceae bacterium 44XB]